MSLFLGSYETKNFDWKEFYLLWLIAGHNGYIEEPVQLTLRETWFSVYFKFILCSHLLNVHLFHYHKLIYCTYNVFYLVMCNTASVAVVEHLTIVWIGDGFGRSWTFCPVRKLRRIVMVNKMDNICICITIVVSVIIANVVLRYILFAHLFNAVILSQCLWEEQKQEREKQKLHFDFQLKIYWRLAQNYLGLVKWLSLYI